MGALPGTLSRRKESQAPSPRSGHAMRDRMGLIGTMPYPARPGQRDLLFVLGSGSVVREL